MKSNSGKLGAGLSILSEGSGVVAPPSVHPSGNRYAWALGCSPFEMEVADAPNWIYEIPDSADRKVRTRFIAPPSPLNHSTVTAAYAQNAVASEIARLVTTKPEDRRETLHSGATRLGSLVAAGFLDHVIVEASLTGVALAVGMPEADIEAALRSGLTFGIAHPADIGDIAGGREVRRRAANAEAQIARQKRLRENPEAMEWLHEMGLTQSTIAYFGFGLDTSYVSRRNGTTSDAALTFPVRNQEGMAISVIGKLSIPGITLNAKTAWWTVGQAESFYAEEQDSQTAVVVAAMPDLWLLWQEIRGTDLAAGVQLIASTQSDVIPSEWMKPLFWERWGVVFAALPADDAGDKISTVIAKSAGKTVRRLRPHVARMWRDEFRLGINVKGFERCLADAPVISSRLIDAEIHATGQFRYQPADLGQAFHAGNLYYAADILVRDEAVGRDGRTSMVERVETVVLRSDGRLLRAIEMPAPPGTPLDKRVLRLDDGLVIDSKPKASASPSWSWESIQKWLEAKESGTPVRERPLGDIFLDVLEAIRRAVWLPFEDDYVVLGLAAVASYCQAIFQAVPLILVTGEPGSGKSALGVVLAQLSANGTVVGQVSAAAARPIHETKGLVVLDDLEGIAAKAGKDRGMFSELVQWLKISYNRETAIKFWVNAGRGFKIERLNGFGIKVVSNTKGVDEILGSRMLRIQTRKMAKRVAEQRADGIPFRADQLQQIRDDLHVWTAESVHRIAETYADICPSATERAEELAAPLRVMARLVGIPQVESRLEAALARFKATPLDPDDAVGVLVEAACLLARQGYKSVSSTHLMMEMRRLIDAHLGPGAIANRPEYRQPEWVGRMLRLRDIVAPGEPGHRARFLGKNLRFYPFSRHFLVDALADGPTPPEKAPTDFCVRCGGCSYQLLDCPLLSARMKAETRVSRPLHVRPVLRRRSIRLG